MQVLKGVPVRSRLHEVYVCILLLICSYFFIKLNPNKPPANTHVLSDIIVVIGLFKQVTEHYTNLVTDRKSISSAIKIMVGSNRLSIANTCVCVYVHSNHVCLYSLAHLLPRLTLSSQGELVPILQVILKM